MRRKPLWEEWGWEQTRQEHHGAGVWTMKEPTGHGEGGEESYEILSVQEQGMLGSGSRQKGRLPSLRQVRGGNHQSIWKAENGNRLIYLFILINKDHS